MRVKKCVCASLRVHVCAEQYYVWGARRRGAADAAARHQGTSKRGGKKKLGFPIPGNYGCFSEIPGFIGFLSTDTGCLSKIGLSKKPLGLSPGFLLLFPGDKPQLSFILVDKPPKCGPTLMTRGCFGALRLAAARPQHASTHSTCKYLCVCVCARECFVCAKRMRCAIYVWPNRYCKYMCVCPCVRAQDAHDRPWLFNRACSLQYEHTHLIQTQPPLCCRLHALWCK